jgi:hypothetical protein
LDLKEAQAAKLATLTAEVAALKLSTLPAPAPPPPAPAVDLDALLRRLTQRGIAVSPEVWAGCLAEMHAPAEAPATVCVCVCVCVCVEAAPGQTAAPAAPSAPAAEAPARAASEGDDAAMPPAAEDGRGRKREADGGGRAATRRSKSACPIAETTVQDMLLRARGIPVRA